MHGFRPESPQSGPEQISLNIFKLYSRFRTTGLPVFKLIYNFSSCPVGGPYLAPACEKIDSKKKNTHNKNINRFRH
jgi:hypothetical protein